MPKYSYKCKECLCEFEIWHSIEEKLLDCEECETENSLQRLPSFFTTSVRTTTNKQSIGEVVKTSIESFKEDLKEEKERMKEQAYKP